MFTLKGAIWLDVTGHDPSENVEVYTCINVNVKTDVVDG